MPKKPVSAIGITCRREPVSDIDTVVVDSLKALDPKRPIREADIAEYGGRLVPTTDRTASVSVEPTWVCCLPGHSYFWALEKAVSSTSPIGCHVRPSN